MKTPDEWFIHALEALGHETAQAVPLLNGLKARYAETHRTYHSLDHIAHMLRLLERQMGPLTVELVLATWYHDAVYDPKRKDNETASAILAGNDLRPSGAPAAVIKRIVDLIQSTENHEPTDASLESRLFVDADLAILGESAQAYDAYAQAIRREYAWVHETDYARGREAVLRRLLQRRSIYLTERVRAERETMARANLIRELERLSRTP